MSLACLATLALWVSTVSLWIETLSFNWVISSVKVADDSFRRGMAFLVFIFGVFDSFDFTLQLVRDQSILVLELGLFLLSRKTAILSVFLGVCVAGDSSRPR